MKPRAYEIVAPLTVYEAMRNLHPTERRRIEELLYRLANSPALCGDFEAPADDGRIHQVKIVGRWILSYWADDAAREIRLTGLELIE